MKTNDHQQQSKDQTSASAVAGHSPAIRTAVETKQPASPNPLESLLSTRKNEPLSLVSSQNALQPGAPVFAISPLTGASHQRARRGRIARLPKNEREMVNRMLTNSVPYTNISLALDELGFKVSERNISNWATGGYLEWRLEQDALTAHRLDQDRLTSFLKREDAQELPEVGLQAAATRLSQIMLQKLARADDPEAGIDSYSKMINLLCRLNREISNLQENRDAAQRSLGKEHDPACVKESELLDNISIERSYTRPHPHTELPSAPGNPELPRTPTGALLASQAREIEEDRKAAWRKYSDELLGKMLGVKQPPQKAGAPPNAKNADSK